MAAHHGMPCEGLRDHETINRLKRPSAISLINHNPRRQQIPTSAQLVPKSSNASHPAIHILLLQQRDLLLPRNELHRRVPVHQNKKLSLILLPVRKDDAYPLQRVIPPLVLIPQNQNVPV